MAAKRRPYASPTPEEFARFFAERLCEPPLREILANVLRELRNGERD